LKALLVGDEFQPRLNIPWHLEASAFAIMRSMALKASLSEMVDPEEASAELADTNG